MNKRAVKLVIILLVVFCGIFLTGMGLKNIKLDEFVPSSVIFVVDASASNQKKLGEQKKFIKQLCNRLDPEDVVKIIRVSEDAYLIFEGSAHHTKAISDSMNEFTKYDSKDWGTAYGVGMEKALGFASSMNNEGYNPSIIVVGDLENEGDISKQINWNNLPNEVKKVQTQSPELVMMFVYAHPQKLDVVKTKLAPVLGESKLIIATEQGIDKAINNFMNAIER
ncbi:MAG: VWA domain-containing protein [Candidatus Gastranaerophilales bacterium]|nr:VWA domain-containing protein [Candidatus Gastranaerophilales bacterium]MCM1072396.1 VWA domain-containing protein [Bacteroides sp.]